MNSIKKHRTAIIQLAQEYSCKEVADILHMKPNSLDSFARSRGIKFQRHQRIKSKFYHGILKTEIIKFSKTHTLRQISEKFDFVLGTFRDYARINGIKFVHADRYIPGKHRHLVSTHLDSKELVMNKVRRNFSPVYMKSVDDKTVALTGEVIVGARTFENWDMFMVFAEPYL